MSVQRLEAKVESFRSQKESLAAGYTAAEAQSRIGTAMAGVDEELGDVGFAVQRARDRTEAMQARAGALEELAEISSPSLSLGDAAQRTLEQLADLTTVRAAEAWEEVRRGPAWTVVLVGDPAHAEGLVDLGLGPVTVVE